MLTVTLPIDDLSAGEIVRWFVMCNDTQGKQTRSPPFLASEAREYWGTMVAGAEADSALPVMYWHTGNPAAAMSEGGWQVRLTLRARSRAVICHLLSTLPRGNAAAGYTLCVTHEPQMHANYHTPLAGVALLRGSTGCRCVLHQRPAQPG